MSRTSVFVTMWIPLILINHFAGRPFSEDLLGGLQIGCPLFVHWLWNDWKGRH